ncbi:MAG: hypothetical protein CVV23_07220 [Ignavibacteriae bacterium HGW-Ignavibacteriae-2]|jgi:Cu(I)/Ag(I) efflux system membrane fusion protein/cobalt-zinc-cadmium efflux system membrane fusion protein|nr:MAG: hypothetical protein CVV23_07220 [Ignavibacteriae bacterium HGW-Ignavibacteriae-2]
MKNISKILLTALLFTGFLLAGNLSAQEKQDSTKHHHMKEMKHKKSDKKSDKKECSCCGESKEGHKHTEMSEKNNHENDESASIVRKGEIDLVSIDKNKDGKVYQDQMCWNVISDEAGKCPLCEMKLKEVSIDKAKENLKKHDFKFKK